MTSCPVCFENNEEQMVALKCCSHEICRPCLKQWYEACERTGQALPTCPQCRLCVELDETADILGHNFSPAGSSGVFQEATEMDEFTQHLLSETARACGNCGVWIAKEDGCDMMQCVCGYRFCFGCGVAGGRDCGCTPATHDFYDNIMEEIATRAPVHVATTEELDELRLYLELTKVKGLMESVLEELKWDRGAGDLCFHCYNRNCKCGRVTFLENVALRGNTNECEGVERISAAEELRNLRSFLKIRRAKHVLLRQIKDKCGGNGWNLFWQSSFQGGGVDGGPEFELKTLRLMLQVKNAKQNMQRNIMPRYYCYSNPFLVWNVVVSSYRSAGVHCVVSMNDETRLLRSFLQLWTKRVKVLRMIWQIPLYRSRLRPPVDSLPGELRGTR